MPNFQHHYNNELIIQEFVVRNYDELCRRFGHFNLKHAASPQTEVVKLSNDATLSMASWQNEFTLKTATGPYNGVTKFSLKYIPSSVSGKDYPTEVDWFIAMLRYDKDKKDAAKAKRDIKNTQKKIKASLEFMDKDDEINRVLERYGWEETVHWSGKGTLNAAYKDRGELRRIYNCGKKKTIGFQIGTTNGTMTMNVTGLNPNKVAEIISGLIENMS